MKISREKACQRLHHRVTTPLSVQIGDESYKALDWSLGGMRLSGWNTNCDMTIGDITHCHFTLPFQGFDIGFHTELEVLRIDEESGEFAGKFVELGEREKELMHHFIEQLIRGAMVPVEDTILRIDSPVTPVSTKPDPSPGDELPSNRLPFKLIAMSAFYMVGGLALFTVVLMTVYNNFFSLRVSTAVTHKTIEPIIAFHDGRVINASVSPGQLVYAGDELFQVSIPEINRQLDEARIEVERDRLELEALRKKHALVVELTGSHLDAEARALEIEIDQVQQEVAMSNESLLALYKHKEDLSLFSPDEGRLIKIYKQPGSQVRRGDTLALFERSEAASVEVYLNDDDAKSLSLNQTASVSSTIYAAEWRGVVTDISPTLETLQQPYLPGRTMSVRLKLVSGELDPHLLDSGSPVSVQFHHPWMLRLQGDSTEQNLLTALL